ncbi:MAG: hypothetical protein GWN87_28520, partial [Desulfuromonadales bacterium]|nr:hypothetical protein [Desulfuromonadales bacterium]
GRDNCLHVKWEWTAKEAFDFFTTVEEGKRIGEEQLPKLVKEQLANGEEHKKSEYLQVIYAAGDPIYRDLSDGEDVAQTHPWLEHFICLRADNPGEEKTLKPPANGPGYWSRPFASWHYHRNWHEVYSRTMAWSAMPDIRGAAAMWEALWGEAESRLQPPTWALRELQGQLDLAPRGANWAANTQQYATPPMYLERKMGYEAAMDFIQRVDHSIGRWWHIDMFWGTNLKMDQKNQPETAYAHMKADAEKVTQLVPEIETFENQVLREAHDIFIDYERMAEPRFPWGRLPEPPQIVLDNAEGDQDQITPEFIGQLSIAQVRDRQVMKFFRAMGAAEMVFEADPNTVHKIRHSQMLEEILETMDFKQHLIVPEEEYEKLVEEIQRRQLQAEIAEMAPKYAQAVKALGGKTEKDSPLALLTGAGA